MQYLIVLKQDAGTGRFLIETSEGASVTVANSFVQVRNKENKVEFLVPVDSLLYVETVFPREEKQEDDYKEEQEESSDKDRDERKLTDEEVEQLIKEKQEVIGKALKKFFNF